LAEPKIFVSVGAAATEAQEAFISAIEVRLRSEGLRPHTIGRNTFSADAPLKQVENLMNECAGAAVIALERTYFENGLDKRGEPREKPLQNVRLPSGSRGLTPKRRVGSRACRPGPGGTTAPAPESWKLRLHSREGRVAGRTKTPGEHWQRSRARGAGRLPFRTGVRSSGAPRRPLLKQGRELRNLWSREAAGC
jgi:hypothetical protein